MKDKCRGAQAQTGEYAIARTVLCCQEFYGRLKTNFKMHINEL